MVSETEVTFPLMEIRAFFCPTNRFPDAFLRAVLRKGAFPCFHGDLASE